MRHRFRRSALVLTSVMFLLSVLARAESLSDTVSKLEDSLRIQNLLDMLTSNLFTNIKSMGMSFSLSFAVIITGTIFSAIKESFKSNEHIFDFTASCLLILSTAPPLTLCISKIQNHLEALCALMLSFVPTIILLYSASGSTLSAAFSSASIPMTVSLLEAVSTSIILPLTKGIFSLTVVNAISKKTNLSGLCNYLKSVCLWIVGLSFTLFTGILSLGSLLQSGMDNLTMKGLKYGASRLIPIAGGMVSESLRTVITGVSTVKTVSGISGILIIIYAVIPPLCTLLCAKLYFGILSCLAKGTNQMASASYLDAVSSVLSILLSILLGCSSSFIIMFGIFMKTGVTL